jgi:hypothetical protein
MRLWSKIAIVLAFVPLVASAQYKDLDTALANVERGFGNGDSQAIVSGIADGGQVMLQFPGLIQQSGSNFYGRDQAAYLLDGLFSKVKPSEFNQKSASKVSAENQWHITGNWTIQNAGKPETRELYITLLHNKDDRWSIVSARSAGK